MSWLQASDAFTRMGAVQALGELIQYAPADPLIAALKDEHAGVREEAVRALGKLGQRAPFNELVTALTDEDKDVRRAVTYQLEVWRGERPVEPLIALLNDTDWEVCEAAIMALKELGERVPLQVYLTALDDEMYLIRETAMQALAERAEQLPIDLFIDALRKKPDDLEAARNWSCGHTDHVRASAVLALGRFGARAPIELLLEALDDGDASVRREAVTALGMLGEHAPTEPILAALGDDDIWVREAAFEALKQHSKVGKLIPKESLFSALANSEETIRALALTTLQQLYPDTLAEVIPEITAIMLGQKEELLFDSLIQSHFAAIIGNIGYPSPIYVEKLSQLLDWPYWEVCMKAIEAFGKLHRPLPGAILRRLLELRHDPQSRAIRKAANEVLDKLLSLETCIEDNEEAV